MAPTPTQGGNRLRPDWRDLASALAITLVAAAASLVLVSQGGRAALLALMSMGVAVGLWALRRAVHPAEVAICAAALLAPMNAVRVSEQVTVADVALALAAVAALARPWGFQLDADLRRRMAWVAGGLLTITAGGLLSCAVRSDVPGVVLLVRGPPAALATVMIVVLLVTRPASRLAVSAAYAVGAASSVALGQVWGNINPVVGRSFGLAVDSNHFGVTCTFGVAAAAYWALTAQRWPGRALAVMAAVTSLGGVAVSGSRASAVGVIVVLIGVLMALRSRGAVPVLLGFVGLGVVAWSVAALGGSTNALARLLGLTETGALSATLSDDARSVLLGDLLSELAHSPWLGLGWSRIREAHMHLLQVAVGAGVLGVLGYIGVVIGLAQTALHHVRARTPASLVMAGGIAAFVVIGFAQNIMWDRYLWLFLGLCLAASVRQEGSRARASAFLAGLEPS